MSLVDALRKLLQEEMQSEVYGGVPLGSVLDAVDLDIGTDESGYLRVVLNPCPSYEHSVPESQLIQKNGERWLHSMPKSHDFEWVSSDAAQVARGRYLLLRDHYHRTLRSMSYSQQQVAIYHFFP